jgi:hypothetical protein
MAKIDSFSAAEEVLNAPNLKSVFKEAINKGCAFVTTKAKAK